MVSLVWVVVILECNTLQARVCHCAADGAGFPPPEHRLEAMEIYYFSSFRNGLSAGMDPASKNNAGFSSR